MFPVMLFALNGVREWHSRASINFTTVFILLLCDTLPSMTVAPSSTNEKQAFEEALSKLVSIPRAEMQKRIKTVPEAPVSRHKRYKYVPAKPQSKP
jgi:hypothetical protein